MLNTGQYLLKVVSNFFLPISTLKILDQEYCHFEIGFLSFSKSCRVLRDFKTNYLLLHEDRVSNDNLNRRKKSTLIREQQLETILEDFSSLNPEQQLNSVIKFSYKIGTIEKFVDLSQNLENSEKYFISTATTEEELDDTIYQTFCDSDSELDSDPESDSESEF